MLGGGAEIWGLVISRNQMEIQIEVFKEKSGLDMRMNVAILAEREAENNTLRTSNI